MGWKSRFPRAGRQKLIRGVTQHLIGTPVCRAAEADAVSATRKEQLLASGRLPGRSGYCDGTNLIDSELTQ